MSLILCKISKTDGSFQVFKKIDRKENEAKLTDSYNKIWISLAMFTFYGGRGGL